MKYNGWSGLYQLARRVTVQVACTDMNSGICLVFMRRLLDI